MSRQLVPMQDGTLLVLGYDEPFQTWYAMHHDDGDENSSPRVAIGYHPAEQSLLKAERPDATIGPYPVATAEELLTKLIPELTGIQPAAQQQMCMFCQRPPWERNDDCGSHPWNRLRYG